MTKDEMMESDERLAEPGSLSEYAAREAALMLADNWAVSLRDGYKLDQLVGDVDDVCEHLRKWAAGLTEKALDEGAPTVRE
jgi:hypothetical protein